MQVNLSKEKDKQKKMEVRIVILSFQKKKYRSLSKQPLHRNSSWKVLKVEKQVLMPLGWCMGWEFDVFYK